jgi:uncharacterized protein with GYD domain
VSTSASLFRWTEQGIKNVKDTVTRVEEGRRPIDRQGGRLNALSWTQGVADVVAVSE